LNENTCNLGPCDNQCIPNYDSIDYDGSGGINFADYTYLYRAEKELIPPVADCTLYECDVN
jgi:hypothetical protein